MSDEIMDLEKVEDVEIAEIIDFSKIKASDIEGMSDFERFELLVQELEVSPKIDIDGRKYTQVAVRLNLFRKYFGFDYSITTDRVNSDDSYVVFKTAIRNLLSDRVVATGHSEKKRFTENLKSGFEFAETASIGRALSSFGIIGGEFASLEEVGVESHDIAGKVVVGVIMDLAELSGDSIEDIEISLKHKRIGLILKGEALDLITKLSIKIKSKPQEDKKEATKAKVEKKVGLDKNKVNASESSSEKKVTLI